VEKRPASAESSEISKRNSVKTAGSETETKVSSKGDVVIKENVIETVSAGWHDCWAMAGRHQSRKEKYVGRQ